MDLTRVNGVVHQPQPPASLAKLRRRLEALGHFQLAALEQLTALSASFTGMFGLHESTATLNAMKEGMSKSLETLSEIGDKVQEEAVKAGYGPTVRADAVKKLVDSVVNFQEKSRTIINEMRVASTKNSAEIRDAVEDGKRRLATLAAEGNALLLETKN